MPHDVIMPQMGESIAEGTITTWLKRVGEAVELDEPLFEMSTDKVDAEIPSPVAGTLLEIKVQPGETVPINTVVAIIGEAGEKPHAGNGDGRGNGHAPPQEDREAPAARTQGAAKRASKADGAPSAEERRRTKSSPVVRKIAAEHGIDISSLTGSGIGGRVTKDDILAHIGARGGTAEGTTTQARPAAPAPSVSAPVAAPRIEAYAPVPTTASGGGAVLPGPTEIPETYRAKVYEGDQVEEMSKMRSLISEHMVLSRRISAHVQTVWEVDFERVAQLRKKHKAAWAERHGTNLTFTSFAMKVAVDALKAFPVMNASLDGNKIIYHRDVNLGMAVALDWGLIVPVIHRANELNLLGLTRRLNDLGTRARDKKLKPDEVAHGTFTITNPGVFGNLFGLPVINQPQVAILGMGGVEKRPVVIDDMIAIRTRAYLSLSFDHRLVDGAVADKFMKRIKDGIEQFDEGDL